MLFLDQTELATIFSGDPATSCYAYVEQTVTSSCQALTMLDDYIAAEGPFDGAIGFSEGASLAAMHIIRKAQQGHEAPFKCAIFISCGGLFDPTALLNRGEGTPLEPKAVGELIRIPTAHIWGENDPMKKEGEKLNQLSEEQLRSVFVHQGGHEVPGLGMTAAVITAAVNAMRRAIDRTRCA